MNIQQENQVPEFQHAHQHGEIIQADGIHEISEGYNNSIRSCKCQVQVKDHNRSYRHTTIQLNGHKILYYHQKPLLVKKQGGGIILPEQVYVNKAAINKLKQEIPAGWIQRRNINGLNGRKGVKAYYHPPNVPDHGCWKCNQQESSFQEYDCYKLDKKHVFTKKQLIAKSL